MRTHKCILSALTLTTAMAFGATAMAADLPKSGTYAPGHRDWERAGAGHMGRTWFVARRRVW
jgi:hypothetical protein